MIYGLQNIYFVYAANSDVNIEFLISVMNFLYGEHWKGLEEIEETLRSVNTDKENVNCSLMVSLVLSFLFVRTFLLIRLIRRMTYVRLFISS